MVLAATLLLCALMVIPARAKTVKANKWYSGRLNEGNKITWTMKMPTDGYIFFEGFENGEMKISKTGSWWEASWEGYSGYVHDSLVRKGSSVRLVMKGSEDFSYRVRMRVTKKAYYEKEKNNSKRWANVLKTGKTMTGELKSGDRDFYVFKAPKTRSYKLILTPLNESGSEQVRYLASMSSKKVSSGTAAKKTVIFNGRLKKGQKIYIKLVKPNRKYVFYDLKAGK